MENKTDFPPFYSGQKVVALKDDEWISKNGIYEVERIERLSCGCYLIMLIGVRRINCVIGCYCAEHYSVPVNGNSWFNSKYFAPLGHKFQSITFEQVVEIESPLIGVN